MAWRGLVQIRSSSEEAAEATYYGKNLSDSAKGEKAVPSSYYIKY